MPSKNQFSVNKRNFEFSESYIQDNYPYFLEPLTNFVWDDEIWGDDEEKNMAARNQAQNDAEQVRLIFII